MPRTITPQAWRRRRLPQPRQQVRRRRCPWPGLVQHLRPVALPLICVRQHLRGWHASHPHPRPWQQAWERYGLQVHCPVLTTLPLIPAGLHRTGRVVFRSRGDRLLWCTARWQCLLCMASRAAPSFQGRCRRRTIQRQHPLSADSRA